jgi:iron(III) transport system substrate-binding protein
MPVALWRIAVLLLLGAALLAGPRAGAQDWQAEWSKLIAAAEKEGAVTVATSPNLQRRDYVLGAWAKDFPGIKLSLTTVRGANFVPTVATERSAGKYLWDVFQSGPTSGLDGVRLGFFDPLLPELLLPEVSDPAVWGGWSDAFYDPEKKYIIGLISDVVAPYYNAAAVPMEKVRQLGLKLLLDPDYKDRIVWYDPRIEGPGSLFLALFDRVLGKADLRRLIADQNPLFVSNSNEVGQAIVRKKAVIALAGQPKGDLKEFFQAGMPLDIKSFGPSPGTAYRSTDGSALAVFANRPHPAASRLFVNWYMSRAVSEGIARATDYDSRRTDLPPLDPEFAAVKGGAYVDPQRDEGARILREWRDETKRLRPQ